MEYLAKCNACNKHTIIKTTKSIQNTTSRKPQRLMKCDRCGKTNRVTIIGTVEKSRESMTINPECGTTDKLIFKLW